jgi:hypothetical protein
MTALHLWLEEKVVSLPCPRKRTSQPSGDQPESRMISMKIFPVPNRRFGPSAVLCREQTDTGSHPSSAMSKTDTACRGTTTINRAAQAENHRIMAEVTIVYWRDIPAQVIVGKGRRGSKVQLTERFEQAIDRCAMKVGARDTDSYLAEWRKAVVAEIEGDPDTIAADYAAKLEADFDTARLKSLIDAEGWSRA